MIMLLASLFDLKGGRRRQEVLSVIEQKQWYDLEPEDRKPYPTTTEPRWKNLISWARLSCADEGLMERGVPDDWAITKDGHNAYVTLRNAFRNEELDVTRCFLWTGRFKNHIVPDWAPNGSEAQRPKYMYMDLLPPWMSSPRGNKSSRLTNDIIELLGLDIDPHKRG